MAQLFADNRVDRDTPCRLATGGEWKTVDEYMPMLKYGTQLPVPIPTSVVRSEDPVSYRSSSDSSRLPQAKVSADARVAIVNLDLPFVSILKLMFKWMAAAFLVFCCFIPAIMLLIFIVMAIFGGLLGHLFSGLPHP